MRSLASGSSSTSRAESISGVPGRTGTIAFGGGWLQYSGNNTVDYSAKIQNSGSAIAIDTNGQSVTFASALGASNTGGLSKSGLGTLTLTASNASMGATTVNGGTLALSGSGSIGTGGLHLGTTGSPGVLDIAGLTASTYSLPSSASLAGVGTISGNGKSLAVLGSLAPGNSVGTITVGTGLSLDLSNSGRSVFEITSPAFTAGTCADGANVLQIFANTGGRSGSFSAANATGLAAGQSATFNPTTGYITVVPEPTTIALMASSSAGLAAMIRWRKRRAAKAAA